MIQIQIALPLLIKQKITNYLDFTIWQEKITKICQQYRQYYYTYNIKHEYVVIYMYDIRKVYNYRRLKNVNYKNIHKKIFNLKRNDVAEISSNY